MCWSYVDSFRRLNAKGVSLLNIVPAEIKANVGFLAPARAFAFAIVCLVTATAVRLLLGTFADHIVPFAVFYPAVFFAALFGGLYVGLFTVVMGAAISVFLFIEPLYSFRLPDAGAWISVAIYLITGSLVAWGAAAQTKAHMKLRDEEKLRQLVLEELSHRLKNKVATIQAIVGYQLRENAESRDAIMSKLAALSATDELIMHSHGRGAQLYEILKSELSPYEVSRVTMMGESLFLFPKFALTMALVIHELATNSGKYGALSAPGGVVAIRWRAEGDEFHMEWEERGGPTVAEPQQKGFGANLIFRALTLFGGKFEACYEKTGVRWLISAATADNMTTKAV